MSSADTEWPIYVLANYEGSGALVELVRSLLPQTANWWHVAKVLAPPPPASAHQQEAGALATQTRFLCDVIAGAFSLFLEGSDELDEPAPKIKRRAADTALGAKRRAQLEARKATARSPHVQGSASARQATALARRPEAAAPRVAWSARAEHRGRYGESLAHVLLINQTREKLIILVLALHLWPALLADVFRSRKLAGLGCLHLAVAQAGDGRLLGHLIELARSHNLLARLLSQRAVGSLFAGPAGLAARARHAAGRGLKREWAWPWSRRTGQVGAREALGSGDFWCDRAAHWPTAGEPDACRLVFASSGAHAAYLGELALAWAVSLRQRGAFEELVRAGADPNAVDGLGNGCLHLLVLNNSPGWSRLLVKSGARVAQENGQRLTALQLACHLGRLELFEELLELSSMEFWSYSMVRCSGYPLTELDSLVERAQQGPASGAVLAILESAESSDEQKAQLLSCGVVKKLLEEKWSLFARRLFYRALLLELTHLFLVTVAITLRPPGHLAKAASAPAGLPFRWSGPTMLQRAGECASLLLAGLKLWRAAQEWLQYRNLRLQWTYNPLLPNILAANLLIVLCGPLRLARLLGWPNAGPQLQSIEDVLLVFAAPLLWSGLLFFIAAFRVTGPFVAMINYMLVRDLRQFSLIYLIFLYSFAQCIFFVNQQPQQQQEPREQASGQLAAYLGLWMDLFKMTLGAYDLQPYRHSVLARLFFLLFIYLIPILFNMLIAMMNNTYSQVISQSERAWSFQWARTLFALERRLNRKERAHYLRLYSINVQVTGEQAGEPASAAETEPAKISVPGLMIIKRMDFTRAERRRVLLSHWQRAMKGVQARRRRRHLEAAA